MIPAPTYAMYRVITEQRGADPVVVPRLGADAGFALNVEATAAAARDAAVVWLCSPNDPTALPEPPGTIEALLDEIESDARTAGREPAIVVLDEAYAEFVGSSLVHLRLAHPNLIVVRTASKGYALAGLRVGFAVARPETIARMMAFRPPGSISTISVSVVTAVLADPDALAANVARVDAERDRLAADLRDVGWSVGPSVTNFLLVDFGTAERAAEVATGLLRRGLVPRTFPAGHPLAHCLRLTIRDRAGDERFAAAARDIEGQPD